MPTEQVIALVISACALLFAGLTYKRNANKDTGAEATERATMTADIRYIRQSVDDIKLETKSTQKDVADIIKRMIIVEESLKTAHQRIDDIMKG